MFYSKEILTRKDTQLGLIWLAATIGSRVSKMSKKEVNKVDIVKTCKDISQPVEPFALRLSSNLMVGVIRVYNQQYNFYYGEVNNTWMRLKKDLALVQSANLDMINPESRLDAVTFEYDLEIEKTIARPMWATHDLDFEVARHSRRKELAVEFGWTDHLTFDLGNDESDTPSVHSELVIAIPSDERRRTITLDERPTEPGSDSNEKFHFNLPDDALLSEDHGLYFDADGNLVDYMPEEGFPVIDEGMETTLPELEVNLGKRKRPGEQDPMSEAQVVPSLVGEVDLEDLGGDDQGHLYPEANRDDVQKRARIGSRQTKSLGLVIDENTMLSREELLEGQEHFMGHQAMLIRELATKQATSDAKARIERMLSKPIAFADCAPELHEFWDSAGTSLRANLADAGFETQAHKRAGKTGRDIPAQYQSLQLADMDLGVGHDFGYDILEPEVRRRHPSVESGGTPVGLGVGGGGGGGVSGSGHFGGVMPWSDYLVTTGAQSDSSVNGSGSEQNWNDFESAFGQTAGTTRAAGQGPQWESEDEMQSEDGAQARRRPRIARSRSGSKSRSLSRDRTGWPRSSEREAGSQTGSLGGHEQALSQDEGGRFAEGPGLTQERLALERETSQFLDFVRSILRDAGGAATSFSFSDVFSIHGRRDVSANAFYHILTLSSMGILHPKQEAPYDDIIVHVH
ncbi:meiotic recombination protein REC8, fungi type [Entomortierella parvispora]|uniref:Meiotic recombination protein REC8, fungi type n=1 Tax=Entomortierella parvispora TaxID=205924 RepID=A0A9P3HL73_9FUNG|nr:meiotic recombination protein REC8, fungi type [Entomortierella parvispora]